MANETLLNQLATKTNQDDFPEQGQEPIILNAKPISIQRKVSYSRGPGGIPIIREFIIIQTEASMSRVIFLLISILIYALIIQIFFTVWQKFHNKSCKITTTFLLFTFPPFAALLLGDLIFFFVCFGFILLLSKTYFNTTKKPMQSDTPKKTYRLFKNLYRTTSIGTIIGKTILIIGFMLGNSNTLIIGILILFFSLYFGLLTRESIEFFSEKMAVNIGYYSREGAPEKIIKNNVCAICDKITDTSSITLNCKHNFHKDCIQGWVFMGKKGFCPCCRENVSFDKFEVDSLQKGENLYSNLIDFLRKAIIFFAVFAVFTFVFKRQNIIK
ncbi:hypothetical protein GVAV_001250 [Gurleya vavrai]